MPPNTSSSIYSTGDSPCEVLIDDTKKERKASEKKIDGSVGLPSFARNLPKDVLLVRSLLNGLERSEGGPFPPLKITEQYGPDLQGAIVKLQGKWFGNCDGIVVPDGETMELLNFGVWMQLASKFFRRDPIFSSRLVRIVSKQAGEHISRIHTALFIIDGFSVAANELSAGSYGPSTSEGVDEFKRAHGIRNTNSAIAAGDIVGRVTVTVMDAEMLRQEQMPWRPPARNSFGWTTRRV